MVIAITFSKIFKGWHKVLVTQEGYSQTWVQEYWQFQNYFTNEMSLCFCIDIYHVNTIKVKQWLWKAVRWFAGSVNSLEASSKSVQYKAVLFKDGKGLGFFSNGKFSKNILPWYDPGHLCLYLPSPIKNYNIWTKFLQKI